MSKSARGIDRCESPIERRLAEAFSRLCNFKFSGPEHAACEIGRWPGWAICLLSQIDSPLGGRPDFCIASSHPAHADNPQWWVIVEADGHDYHERTKEQAARDRRRDREWQLHQTPIFRFTGSEIHRDADACASEVLSFCIDLQRPLLDQLFTEHLERSAKAGAFR